MQERGSSASVAIASRSGRLIMPSVRRLYRHGIFRSAVQLQDSPSPVRCLSTVPSNRHVRMDCSRIDRGHPRYPTPGDGHEFHMHIFGLRFSTDDILTIQEAVWGNRDSFLPRRPAAPVLPSDSPLAELSRIGAAMAVQRADGSPGLLARNQLRQTVAATLQDTHCRAAMGLLKAFQSAPDGSATKESLAQTISDVAFWTQWLLRGVLFEGKLHGETFCAPVVRAPLSQIAFAANAALGRHQIEFVYDDYTLKAAILPDPSELDLERDVNYDDPASIVAAVAAIRTPVGFWSAAGGSPEHNFRHVHSLMELQMRRAFRGGEAILAGDAAGWAEVVEAARRANRVFQTMLRNTPPESYPAIRLPIKGVRGACGSVYHPHGVFYEGVGTDTYVLEDGTRLSGAFIDDEWGQTGANSSMYKWFDLFCGVTQARQAYAADPVSLSKMAAVFEGHIDSGHLGDNPIDSMQRAFDLFTRPPLHMKMLVDTEERLRASGVLTVTEPRVLLQRLRLAYWVAQHRMTHGKYVLASIYQTEPVGGQSRAEGTGGSSPPFLKLFLDQTLRPARGFIIRLLMQQDRLDLDEREEVCRYAREFDAFEKTMEAVRSKGQQLEFDEHVSSAHA